MKNQVRNEIFRQMSLTLTLPLDVPVRPMDAKGLTLSAAQDVIHVIKTRSRLRVWVGNRNTSYLAGFSIFFFMVL